MCSATAHEILDTAGVKICKSNQFDPQQHIQTFAVMGERFCLDIYFGHNKAIAYQQKSVSGYLRVCSDTTDDRVWQNTLYPSEPVLACAASQRLHERPHHLRNALESLQAEVASGLIDVGKSGELVSRLILLVAKDLYVRQWTPLARFGLINSETGGKELLDCQPLPVLGYLAYLFGSDWLTPSIKEKFGGWYVNFSHWIAMDEVIQVGGEYEIRYVFFSRI